MSLSTAVVDTVTPSPVVAVSPVTDVPTGDHPTVIVDHTNTGSDDLSDFEFVDGSQATNTSSSTDTDNDTTDTEDSASEDDTLVGVVGELYDEVPARMIMDTSIISEVFYAVYVGRRVGITTESSIASALMTKLPGGSQKSFKTQEGAVAAFNRTLAIPGAVRVAYQ